MMSLGTKLTRRQMLRLSAGSLLSAGLWPGVLHAGDVHQTEEFHFLVVNDTHYLDDGCGKWLEGVMQRMKSHKQKIDFCLMLGDLSEHGRRNQITPVRDVFQTLNMPVHFVVGNHDYLSQEDRKAFEDGCPNSIN